MAFKMKGSPVKMGVIQGTTGHSSALTQKAWLLKQLIKYGKKLFTKSPKTVIKPPPVDKTGDFIRKSLKKQLSEPVRKIK